VTRLADWVIDRLDAWRSRLDAYRSERRWRRLRQLGMRIGANVSLPASTWVDVAHCYLISIGDDCTFGPECLILAHDAQMDEFLDAGRIGRVVIHEQCHVGPRCVVLCNVEVGPRTIVGPGSVVVTSLPPDTYCAGAPARVISPLADYLDQRRAEVAALPSFTREEYERRCRTPEGRAALAAAQGAGSAYIVGGKA
jgi:maltose O-acetyltransferase